MRIGIDATALPPQPVGAGNYIVQLVRALARLESEDEFVVFSQAGKVSLLGTEDRPEFRITTVPNLSPAVRLTWEQAMLPLVVKNLKIDVFHSLHYTRPLWLPCKSVVTFHDMTFFLFPQLHTGSKRLFFPLAIRASARLAQALIAVSENTRQDAIRLVNIPPEKIFTTPLGVDQSFRPIRDLEGLKIIRGKYDLPERFILYVGLVEPRKNLPVLIRAYRELIEVQRDFDLVVVGRFGWMSEGLLAEVDRLGVKERIRFTGYVPQEDLPWVYNLSSLFVYPTRYEGFGLPALEAMACGVPVITTNVSSMPEIVGDAGFLVEPDSEESLKQAMAEVLADPGLSAEMAARGLERAKQFTWERTARETLRVYQHVCEIH
jgi:glycosyltransferase involved in cell wall biosynthesis